MRRRAARCVAAFAVAVALASALAGCDTTQDKNTRAELSAVRSLAARKPVLVRRADPSVRVEGVTAVGGSSRSAVVVRLRNLTPRVLGDLRVSLLAGSHRLNASKNLPYFQTHLPLIDGGSRATWVWVAPKRLPRGRVRVRVGSADLHQLDGRSLAPGPRAAMPRLTTAGVQLKDSTVVGSLRNASGPPQYAVEVYAVVSRGDRPVAAGRVVVTRLSSGKKTGFVVPLRGRAPKRGASIEVFAIPTVAGRG